MLASQNTLEGYSLLSPVSKFKKYKAQYDILMHDTLILIKKKKYKKTYYTLDRYLMTVNSIDFLEGKDKLKLNYRIFYVLEKIIKNKLTKKEVQKGQSIKQIESINMRMVDAFVQFNDVYQSILREESLRNTLESNKQLITLVNHEDAISKLFCMSCQLYINNYFLESLKSQVFLAIKYLIEAKEFIRSVYTLNNSHILEQDVYITILLGNFYSENGLHKKALDIFQEGIKSIIMLLRYRYTQPNPSLDTEEDEDDTVIWKQRRFQRTVKLIISYLYSFAYIYEKIWKVEHAYEALQLARYLGKHVLFDNTDEFKRYLIHIEHELDTKYSKVVQETLEIESIVAKELQQNRKWYQMAEMLKEQKQSELDVKNMYDEELYQKHNVRKLNQSKMITIKKQDEDSFRTFYTTTLKKKQSQGDSFLSKTIGGGTMTTGDKTQNTDKRERATTMMSTQMNDLQVSDSRYFSPNMKCQTDTFNESKPPTFMHQISEQRSNISGGSSDAIFNQRKRNNTNSYLSRDQISSLDQSSNDKKSLLKKNDNNTYSFTVINQKNNQSYSNNNSNNSGNLVNVQNFLNNLNNSKSSENIKDQKYDDTGTYNQQDKLLKKNSQDGGNQNNSNIIDSHKIDIWGTGLEEIQEKAPSYRKNSRNSRSLTHNNSGLQRNSISGQLASNYNPDRSTGHAAFSQSGNKIGRGESSNSLWSARQAQPNSLQRNKSASNGRFSTPQGKQSNSNRNSKGSYNINYGRMSIRIQDINNHENFGALSNLLLNDKLEKLEEDSNTQEANSNVMFDSPSSSSSTLSPTQRNGQSIQQNQTESKQFRSKTLMQNSSSAMPQTSSKYLGDDKFGSRSDKLEKGGFYSDSKSNMCQQSNEKIIFGQSVDMTNFDTQNFDKQNKDVTNLDYYLSQHIYKALQKSFVSKSYSKIKKDISEWRRKDDLQKKNLLFGKKMLKFRMKEDLIRPNMRKLDSSVIKNISTFRQTVHLNAQQDTQILDIQDQMDNHKQDKQEKKNQIMQKLNETRDSQSQISDYDEDQNVSMLFNSTNKKESLRDIILKHRSIFPLTRVRKLLKDRKKILLKKQQQEILKNRYRQSITGNTNSDLLAFVSLRKSDNASLNPATQPTKVRFASQSDMQEDSIKGDDSPEFKNDQNNQEGRKYYLRNKELLHNMIDDYETTKEKELRGTNTQRYRVFSSDTAMLQQRRSASSIGGPPKPKQLAFLGNNKDLALSTSLLHAVKSNGMDGMSLLNVINLQKIAKTRQTIKDKITKVQVE